MKIGVDLGGTKIKAGVEKNGSIIQQNTILLQQKESLSATLTQLIDLIKPLTDYSVSSIGIGVPSVVDTDRGIVYNVANIPSWEKVALRDILEEEFNVPVFVNNDVNCFTLGEHRYGMAKDYNSVVGMTIGTGLGSGIIIDNQLYIGNNCGAGEIGMLPYRDHTFEYYACSNFFDAIHGTSAIEASREALAGNKRAISLWSEFGVHLGFAIKAVLYVYDPEVIVLGGSIAKAYPLFKAGMMETLQDFAYPESLKRLKIFQSQNDDIAMLGAAALVAQECKV
ncbi:ROK family protein [Runella sp.]|uniref:ROK family protein n=1 Tax=Runella sp. TaxID=1960881 RepID=UPI003D0C0DB4